MKATQTLFVDLERLQMAGPEAILIIRLMMAANDIALANGGLRYFKREQPRLLRHAQLGACRYFVRLQCGHLNEAMKLIQEVYASPALLALVERCTQPTRDAFQRLKDSLPGGAQYDKCKSFIEKIRHNVTFHYQPKPVEKALADRASRLESKRSTVTRGTHISLWRFGVADDVIDSIVCRQLWQIPRSADLRTEADRIEAFGEQLCRDFLDFCGELTIRYVQEHAAL
ncbi:MAG: hypothetical protein HYZ81_27470 [Nitrospinae bacterium]|nr:hypothetical protein [Nitrospinota bacterium]